MPSEYGPDKADPTSTAPCPVETDSARAVSLLNKLLRCNTWETHPAYTRLHDTAQDFMLGSGENSGPTI